MIILEEIRCPVCGKKMMNLSGHAEIKCGKCKSIIEIDTNTRKVAIKASGKNSTK